MTVSKHRYIELDLFQQRSVAILRQTLGKPRLLCIDEPTVGLNDSEAASGHGADRALGRQKQRF